MVTNVWVSNDETCDFCHKRGYLPKRGSLLVISQRSREGNSIIFAHQVCLSSRITKALQAVEPAT